ncbi:hypothetical protein EVAR_27752_1 [Eumeta japonica]|uniref:Uncharacterized protein n=1 Tax=Eumeta variegata TaxID=151549 RepID=A0A4C1VC11_EUMVA|nr:hypothetical protein EVAR_27752_1 [Eumeta japonica]
MNTRGPRGGNYAMPASWSEIRYLLEEGLGLWRVSGLMKGELSSTDGIPHMLPRLSLVPPCSRSSSADIPPPHIRSPLSHGDESLTVVLSAFYAKLLIVLGIAFPITSTIQNERYTNYISDVFTVFLYITSMLFLAYTFYHLRIAKKIKNVIAAMITKELFDGLLGGLILEVWRTDDYGNHLFARPLQRSTPIWNFVHTFYFDKKSKQF